MAKNSKFEQPMINKRRKIEHERAKGLDMDEQIQKLEDF